ncbi:MAG: phosphoribosylanthranilate isomerase [Steroidobacteraceae bacterium]
MDTLWIKVCGLTDATAITTALEQQVDAIGFVFAPSPRQVSIEQALRLAEPARGKALCVAVTLHPSAALVTCLLEEFQPDLLQVDLTDLASLPPIDPSRILPVVRQQQTVPIQWPARVLFEGPRSGAGLTADWQQAAQVAAMTELVLAGGLSPNNVATAIREVRPFGVDVSSGVEASPGHKSPQKIIEFVEAARRASAGV